MQCLASAVLPQVKRVSERQGAGRGRVLHKFLELAAEAGVDAAVAATPAEFRAAVSVIELESLPTMAPGAYSVEVTLAYSVVTRECRVGKADNSAGEIEGTLDVVGVTDDCAVVWDYKTGKRYLGRPANSTQLQVYALMAARAFTRDRVKVGFIRLDEFGEAHLSWHVFEAIDLAEIADELERLVTAIYEADEDPMNATTTEGPECAWCESFARCPAKTSLLLAGAGIELAQTEALSLEQLGQAYLRAKNLRTALEVVDRLTEEALVQFDEVPLPNGNVLRRVEKGRAVVDVEKAKPLIEAEYGPNGLVSVLKVEESITLGDLDALVAAQWRAKYGKAKGVGKARKAERARLLAAGGIQIVKHWTNQEGPPTVAELPSTEEQNHGEEKE